MLTSTNIAPVALGQPDAPWAGPRPHLPLGLGNQRANKLNHR